MFDNVKLRIEEEVSSKTGKGYKTVYAILANGQKIRIGFSQLADQLELIKLREDVKGGEKIKW